MIRPKRKLVAVGAAWVVSAGVLTLALMEDSEQSPRLRRGDRSGVESERDAACGARAPTPSKPSPTMSPPPLAINPQLDYHAIVMTSCGEFQIDLLERRSPRAVNNFIFLANEGFYNGLIWHPVIANHSIRTGDPNNRPGIMPDGPGYTLPTRGQPRSYRSGDAAFVEMENVGIGSQFFVVVHDFPGALQGTPRPIALLGGSVIFGKVTLDTLNIPELISRTRFGGGAGPASSNEPRVPTFIESITIHTR